MHNINYQQESENIKNWIKKVFDNSGLQKIVIGLSGGIDSALACTLAAQAIGKDHIIPVLLPYGSMNSESVADAKSVIAFLGIPEEQIKEIDIQSGVDGIIGVSPSPLIPLPQGEENDVRKGNVMARVRMIYLFDLAKQHKGLVCGTENKSEHYLGYFTRFGDEASDMEPIRHLYKTQVWEMGKFLGLPEKIITKAPTAGLWHGQTDEEELGFTYAQADEVLSYFIDKKLAKEDIIGKGLDTNIVEKVLQRVKANEFKHTLPFIYS